MLYVKNEKVRLGQQWAFNKSAKELGIEHGQGSSVSLMSPSICDMDLMLDQPMLIYFQWSHFWGYWGHSNEDDGSKIGNWEFSSVIFIISIFTSRDVTMGKI